jgi:hypothetical protein
MNITSGLHKQSDSPSKPTANTTVPLGRRASCVVRRRCDTTLVHGSLAFGSLVGDAAIPRGRLGCGARQFRRLVLLITVTLLGLLASLDPLRPVVFVLVLGTKRARVNAIGFLVGWSLALAVLFAVGFAAFNAGASGRPSSAQKTWLAGLELVLACLLLATAGRRWRRRNDTTVHRTTPHAVLRQLDRLTPPRSSFLGVLIQPRTLTIAAAVVVARDRSGFASALAGLGLFALLSTGALLALFAYFVRRPDSAQNSLSDLASRIEQAGPMLFTTGCALGGAYLLVDSVRGLTR